MPSLTSRVKRSVLHAPVLGPAARALNRQRSIARILASGLFDRDWYQVQTGREFASAHDACVDYVRSGRTAGMSPHPLFEPSVAEPRTWNTRGTDPLTHYLRSPWRRVNTAPHHLFDPAVWLELHPEAARHPAGALGHFVATAGPDTNLPVHAGPAGPVRWGAARVALFEAVRTWRGRQDLRGPGQVATFDTAAERAFRAGLAPLPDRPAHGGAGAARSAPLVSIVLPTWNRAPLLRRAVESVRAQTLDAWELVVVDDGSTDDTAAVLEGLVAFEDRIRVVPVPHGGVSRARNVGLAAARADHVAFLDSDNTWQPDFLATMLAGLAARGLDAAHSAMELRRDDRVTWRAYDGGRQSLLAGNHIDLNVLVARTSLVREVGGFAEDLLRAVDYDLVLRISARVQIGYLPFVGAVYAESTADPNRISNSQPLSFDTVVRFRHNVDLAAAREVPRRADTVSVVIPVDPDPRGALALLDQLAVDAGGPRPDAAEPTADELPAVRPDQPGGPDDAEEASAPGGQEPDDDLDPELDDDLHLEIDDDLDLRLDADAGPERVPDADPGLSSEQGTRPAAAASGPGGRRVEIVVVDAGGTRATAVALAAARLRDDRVRGVVATTPVGHPYGVDLGLTAATGAVVVMVDARHSVERGWLDAVTEPLVDEAIAAVGLVFVGRAGPVLSAGAVFGAAGDLPVPLLAGQPGDEATQAGRLDCDAVWSPVLAARTADVLAVGGMDPIYATGLWDVDLSLRLTGLRGGRSVTATSVAVIGTGPLPLTGRGAGWDQRLLAERWGRSLPSGASAAWAVTGTRLAHVATARGRDGVTATSPVVVRDAALVPDGPFEGRPSLRWVVQTGAPAGPGRLSWGDWHFAQSLASALRGLGQQVVVEPRDTAGLRPAAHLDDVVLVLRGLTRVEPDPGVVNLLWVISHPDQVGAAELARYDAVFAASTGWARRMSTAAGRPVEPLLQCTDPARFHPGVRPAPQVEPVLFVGNSRRVMRPVVEQALAARPDLAVWGGGWQGLLPPANIRGSYIPNDQLAGHYASAGVVLNDHWDDMRSAGFLSNRLFDIVASGGRTVSDDVEGLTEVFGDAVVVFDTPDRLRQLLLDDPAELFGNDAARAATARRVLERHSFRARAHRLLEVALAARSD